MAGCSRRLWGFRGRGNHSGAVTHFSLKKSGQPWQPVVPALAACCKGGVGRVASATGPNARRSAASALDIKHAGHLTSAATKQAARLNPGRAAPTHEATARCVRQLVLRLVARLAALLPQAAGGLPLMRESFCKLSAQPACHLFPPRRYCLPIRVALHHKTTCKYDRLVRLSPQVIRLRPAPHCRTRVTVYSLKIESSGYFIN